MESTSSVPFGAKLASLLETHGISQASLSEKSGVDRSLISRMVRGDRKPSTETLRQLAPALAIDIAELVRGTDAEERLDGAIYSIEHDDYVAAMQRTIECEARNRELNAQLTSIRDALTHEEKRRVAAEIALSNAHMEQERARQDAKEAREHIQRQEQELRRYRKGISRAVAQVASLRAKLRAIDEELASTKKSARLAAILSGVAALTGAVTIAYFLGGSDSETAPTSSPGAGNKRNEG